MNNDFEKIPLGDEDIQTLRDSILGRLDEVDTRIVEVDNLLLSGAVTAWELQAIKTLQGHLINILNILNNLGKPLNQ